MSSSSGPALTNQGQVDWVAFSRSTLHITHEIAGRIACANLVELTVDIGIVIGSLFRFPPEGQDELKTSLSALKGNGFFADTLWYGFGIKHIVRTLAETEQGAMCVALCAALTTHGAHSPEVTGSVLHQLCYAADCPSQLVPSIAQWAKLTQVCSGALLKSQFSHTYNHFYHLLVAPTSGGSRPVVELHQRDRSFAEAILHLGRLSTGSMSNAVFQGNAKCALLAAIAWRLLRLSIQIQDEDGNILFSSQDRQIPQATFVRRDPARPSSRVQETVALKRYFLVTSERLIPSNDRFPTRADLDDLHASPTGRASSFTMGPSSRETFLSDTFANWLRGFRVPGAVQYLKAALLYVDLWDSGVVDLLPTRDGEIESFRQALGHLRRVCHSRVSGIERLRLFERMFPELKSCFEDPMVRALEGPELVQQAKALIPTLAGLSCDCGQCGAVSWKEWGLSYDYHDAKENTCILFVSWKVSFVCNLSLVVKDLTDLQISPSILQVRSESVFQLWVTAAQALMSQNPGDWIGFFLQLFIDSPVKTEVGQSSSSAANRNGLCVSLPILRDPAIRPSQGFFVELSAGGISHLGRFYENLCDGMASEAHWHTSEERLGGANHGLDLVVGDHAEPNSLEVVFRVKDKGGYEYHFAPGAAFLRVFGPDCLSNPTPDDGLPRRCDDPAFASRFRPSIPRQCCSESSAKGLLRRFWIGWLASHEGEALFALPLEFPQLHVAAERLVQQVDQKEREFPRPAVRDVVPCPGCILSCAPTRLFDEKPGGVPNAVTLQWLESFQVLSRGSPWALQRAEFKVLR